MALICSACASDARRNRARLIEVAAAAFRDVDLPSRSLSAGYSMVWGYLIGRLALNRTLHGQGLGTQLLLDALERIVGAADQAGGRVIGHSSRLVMKLATAAAILG